ncbi:23S rRNA (uracil1939-C5)-methyltransferase [Alkalibacillus flavidus]|uniref:23S rRNA (Uracil1939-C5)-methyltransferase n=1 Tax=Alkalibacillus flavidus TaxID=546021 RepID=A0ABV2KUH9_9BACI
MSKRKKQQQQSNYNQTKPKDAKHGNVKPRDKSPQKEQTAKVTCTGFTNDGKGIAEWEGKQLEVPYLLPGETAEIYVTKKGRFVNASVKRILEAADSRVKPPCPYYYDCGGCQLQHMGNRAQGHFKQDVVNALMKPFGKPNAIMTMDHPYDYRNKSHTSFGMNRKRQIIGGLYAQNSHRIIPMDECLIHDPKADAIVGTIKGMMKSFKMEPYNEDTGRGFLRHVLVKVGKKTGEIMVVLIAGTQMFKGKNNFIKALRKEHPEISTILLNVNDKNTSMVLGDQEKVLFGKGTITDELCGLKFEISSKSFYQINPEQTEKLYGKAIEMAGLTDEETVIDAYCGVGTIGLVASQQAGRVIGVESNKDAIRDAIRNSKRNGIQNARFYQGDAGEFMTQMAMHGDQADVVILDPPRTGSDEAFLSSVVKLKPSRVIYVSCNPETQARDMKYLTKNGYQVEEMQPVDMFPQTYHVESVAKLTLKM